MEFEQARELAKGYDPSQPRDRSNGRWSDRLGVGKRQNWALDRRLIGSSGHEGGGNSEIAVMALATPDGPELRIGQVDSGDAEAKWGGANYGGTARFAGADADRVAEELAAVRELHEMASEEMRSTIKRLDAGGVDSFDVSEHRRRDSWAQRATTRGEGIPTTPTWRAETERANRQAARTDYVVHPPAEGDTTDSERRWFDEDKRRKFGDDQANIDLWTDEHEFYAGVIEGEWTDIHWSVRGADAEERGDWVRTSIRVEPHSNRDLSFDELPDVDHRGYEASSIDLPSRKLAQLVDSVSGMRTAAQEG